jgi:hypothetical protein
VRVHACTADDRPATGSHSTTGPEEMLMTSTARTRQGTDDAVADAVEQERLLLVRCIETAYESLRLMPGVDTSGRTLVWFAGRLLLAHHRAAGTDTGTDAGTGAG